MAHLEILTEQSAKMLKPYMTIQRLERSFENPVEQRLELLRATLPKYYSKPPSATVRPLCLGARQGKLV